MEEQEHPKPDHDMMKNIEQIQNFSRLLGQGESENGLNTQDMTKVMEMAGKMSRFFGMLKEKEEEEEKEVIIEEQSAAQIFSPSKEIRMLSAAIPFLDKEYQKNIFIAVKLLELRRAGNMKLLHIQSDESLPMVKNKDRRGPLLRAIRPYLSQEEQKNIDMMLKVMKVKSIMATMNKEEL